MLKKLFPILVLLAALGGAILLFTHCSAEQRMARLAKNNPRLADTVYKDRLVPVPGYTFTGSTAASTNTSGIDSVLQKYSGIIDSLTRRKLTQEIHNHIINRSCLDGPVTFSLPRNGTATLSQTGGTFYLNVDQPPQKIPVKIPIAVFNLNYKLNWQSFGIGGLAGCAFALTCVFLIVKTLKHG